MSLGRLTRGPFYYKLSVSISSYQELCYGDTISVEENPPMPIRTHESDCGFAGEYAPTLHP